MLFRCASECIEDAILDDVDREHPDSYFAAAYKCDIDDDWDMNS